MSKSRGKCSPGILKKSRNSSNPEQHRSNTNNKKLNIRIHDPSRPRDPRQAEAEERRFEELKRHYFDQCNPINRHVVEKCGRPFDSDDFSPKGRVLNKLEELERIKHRGDSYDCELLKDREDMNIFKTVRGNLKVFNDDKNHYAKDTETTERKKRNSGANNASRSRNEVIRRNIGRGCGAHGCCCMHCVCGTNCQVDCRCMRRM